MKRHSTLLHATLLACAAALGHHAIADTAANNVASTAAAATTAALPPIEDFFEHPAFSGAALSPSGKYLAVRIGSRTQRDKLAVVELSTNKINVVADFDDADVDRFVWVNDERLAFTATDNDLADGDVNNAPGLYAINRDGTLFRQLAHRGNNFVGGAAGARNMLPWNTYMLGQANGQNSEYIYVRHPSYSPNEIAYVDLQRLNTLTGQISVVPRPGNTSSWMLDNKGEPRISSVVSKSEHILYYRDPADQEWRKLASFNAYTGGADSFTPLAFGPDGTLYAVSNNRKDKQAVYTVDVKTGKLADKPLIELDGYDFTGRLLFSKDKLLGVRFLTDAQGTEWLDPGLKALQADIDKLLPSTNNIISVPHSPETPWVLVNAYSDVQPSTTLLYNRDTKLLTPVGSSHPKIDPMRMGPQTLVHYKGKDGLDIPAWLTLPRGQKKNLPLVVLVHGGPYVRGGEWRWHPMSQFLASRGYAVLEPEYRGSTGFGNKHFTAGWKQWGLKMQDDIDDGARWAIAQGIVDAKRVCIAGASYGGYATLMGLIKSPELYQCGIDWVGVTDINLLRNGHWSFTSDMPAGYREYGMPYLVGDPVKDAEQMKATSPLLRAASIKQPLLLAYGGADVRVPAYHGTQFYDAVKQTNKDVEWVEYPEEGHGWHLLKNNVDFWGRVEKFLSRQIGPQSGAAAATAAPKVTAAKLE